MFDWLGANHFLAESAVFTDFKEGREVLESAVFTVTDDFLRGVLESAVFTVTDDFLRGGWKVLCSQSSEIRDNGLVHDG